MKSFFSALFKGKGTAKINGTHFVGESIIITTSSTVVVDGQQVGGVLLPPIHVGITGDVQHLDGPVASIVVEGSVDKINTVSGDVRCGNVLGSVETVSGEVFCSAVGGRVSTVSGDVRVFGGDVGDK